MRDEPILFVHGFATSFQRTWVDNGWTALVEDAGREAIGVDLLGHGDAPKPHEPEAYDDLGARVIEALPDRPVDVVAFSLGARVVLGLLTGHPDRFSRVVLSGVGSNLFRDERSQVIVDAVRGEAGDDPVSQYFAGLANDPSSDREALAMVISRPRPPVDPDALATIRHQVLVVLGDHDFAGPADPLVDALPNAELVTLRGVDHFSTPKDFGFIDAALGFLDAQPF